MIVEKNIKKVLKTFGPLNKKDIKIQLVEQGLRCEMEDVTQALKKMLIQNEIKAERLDEKGAWIYAEK